MTKAPCNLWLDRCICTFPKHGATVRNLNLACCSLTCQRFLAQLHTTGTSHLLWKTLRAVPHWSRYHPQADWGGHEPHGVRGSRYISLICYPRNRQQVTQRAVFGRASMQSMCKKCGNKTWFSIWYLRSSWTFFGRISSWTWFKACSGRFSFPYTRHWGWFPSRLGVTRPKL